MIKPLVARLDEQISKGTYDFNSNLWLIKLYQFFPEQLDESVVSKVLLRALMAMPNPDFGTTMFVVAPSVAVRTKENRNRGWSCRH